MPTVGYYCSHSEVNVAGDKYFLPVRWLQHAGCDVLTLVWHEDDAATCNRLGIPHVRLFIAPGSRLVTAEEERDFINALNIPVGDNRYGITPPSLGEYLGYDEFPGCAVRWNLDGFGGFAPDLIVTPSAASENMTPQDSYLKLLLARFCHERKLPLIQIEATTLNSPMRLQQWPGAVFLTRRDPRTYAGYPTSGTSTWVKMPASHRYAFSLGQDSALDELSLLEPNIKAQIGPPGMHFIFLPMHLAFKQVIQQMLASLMPLAPTLTRQGLRLLIGCSTNSYRKRLTEREMCQEGLAPLLAPWGEHFGFVEGVPLYTIAGMADAVLSPCHTPITDSAEAWGQTVIYPENLSDVQEIAFSFPLADMVSYLLEKRSAQ